MFWTYLNVIVNPQKPAQGNSGRYSTWNHFKEILQDWLDFRSCVWLWHSLAKAGRHYIYLSLFTEDYSLTTYWLTTGVHNHTSVCHLLLPTDNSVAFLWSFCLICIHFYYLLTMLLLTTCLADTGKIRLAVFLAKYIPYVYTYNCMNVETKAFPFHQFIRIQLRSRIMCFRHILSWCSHIHRDECENWLNFS